MKNYKIEFSDDIKKGAKLIDVEKFLIRYSHKTPSEMIYIVDFCINEFVDRIERNDFEDRNEGIAYIKQLYAICLLKDELNGYFADVNYGKVLEKVREKKEKQKNNSI